MILCAHMCMEKRQQGCISGGVALWVEGRPRAAPAHMLQAPAFEGEQQLLPQSERKSEAESRHPSRRASERGGRGIQLLGPAWRQRLREGGREAAGFSGSWGSHNGFSLKITYPPQRGSPPHWTRHHGGRGVDREGPPVTSSCPQAVHVDTQQHTANDYAEHDAHVQGEQSGVFFPRGSCPVQMGCPRPRAGQVQGSAGQPQGRATGQEVQED